MFNGSPSPPPLKKNPTPHLHILFLPKTFFFNQDPPSLLKRPARVSNDSLNPEHSLRARGAIPPFHHKFSRCGCWTNHRNFTFISHLQTDILTDLFCWGFANKLCVNFLLCAMARREVQFQVFVNTVTELQTPWQHEMSCAGKWVRQHYSWKYGFTRS
jgi:hypothetical protein